MNLKFQATAIEQLQNLAESDRHSLLIEGGLGCGKSYLAKQYATMLGVSDCYSVNPTVQAIRDTINQMYNISDKVVLCIENLDLGVLGASYTLLKFLEEPKSNIYVIVTCRNRYKVPDTIISRSTTVSLLYPTYSDIQDYAQVKNAVSYENLHKLDVWKAVRSLRDVDNVYKLTDAQLYYYSELSDILAFKEPVSNIVWKLQHYSDDTETDLEFVLNYLISITKNRSLKKHIMDCARDISSSRIASHAALAKLVFEGKYGT